jgi:hypothetical protein
MTYTAADRPAFAFTTARSFHKWNSNAGLVHKTSLADKQHHHRLQHAHATDETSSESCVPATSDDGNGEVPTVDDVPQCFTHWTYAASRHTRMVCDLQGFFTGGRFVLVDPVRGHVAHEDLT